MSQRTFNGGSMRSEANLRLNECRPRPRLGLRPPTSRLSSTTLTAGTRNRKSTILLLAELGSGSSGGPRTTATILTAKRTFIPIPDEIAQDFLPDADERKRLEVQCEFLYLSGM